MKLSVLGGGGVRIPTFVRALLASRPGAFDEICLFEPDATRRATTARLAAEVAGVLGQPGVVTVTADAAEAFTGADYIFSAIRVGGDRGRVIDEQVALRRGIVGQETTGPGGCAMALRTIPVPSAPKAKYDPSASATRLRGRSRASRPSPERAARRPPAEVRQAGSWQATAA